MSGKTEEEKKIEETNKAEKKAAEAKAKEEKAKADAEKKAEADKKASEKKAAKDAKDAESKKGFLEEISEKIEAAESFADLEALNDRVYDIWGDDVPTKIQELAFKKGEELEEERPSSKLKNVKGDLQKDWVKVTSEELKQAEKDGKLAGYDPETQTALINE